MLVPGIVCVITLHSDSHSRGWSKWIRLNLVNEDDDGDVLVPAPHLPPPLALLVTLVVLTITTHQNILQTPASVSSIILRVFTVITMIIMISISASSVIMSSSSSPFVSILFFVIPSSASTTHNLDLLSRSVKLYNIHTKGCIKNFVYFWKNAYIYPMECKFNEIIHTHD